MIDWVILGIYVVGYAWFWRHCVGFFLHMDGWTEPKEVLPQAMAAGSIWSMLWPLVVPVLCARWLYVRYIPDDSGRLLAFFPPPRKVESRRDRRSRELMAMETRNLQQAREIERLEKELGMGTDQTITRIDTELEGKR